MKFALSVYRRLAHAFPHEFKVMYGADVLQLGEDVVEEIAKQHGFMGLIRLIADIAIRVPIEYLSEMRRDMIYAIRALIKSPGFALVGIISLGLGMGVTTSAFTTLYAQLFRELPAANEPARLVVAQSVSYPYFERYRDEKGLFSGAAVFKNGVPFNVAFGGTAKPERVFGHLVSPEYFSVLGVRAQRGRMLSADTDKPGDAPVVVISDRFWRTRLNADPGAIGRTLRLNGQTATIVGIGPQEFLGAMPYIPGELFVPVTVPASLAPELADDVVHQPDAKTFNLLLRLAPGVTIESAEAGLDSITRHLDEEMARPAANAPSRDDKTRRVRLLGGGTMIPIPREMKPVMLGFYGMLIGLLLTIACMNLASMLLARAAGRRKEVAIRLAVGASRFRLIRQMLSESILLAVLGGMAGLGLAYWLSRLSSQIKLPINVPVEFNYSMDWRALAVTFALAVICGIGFGMAPALQATRADVAPTLKEGAGGELRGYRRFGMRNLLVVSQVAGSLMLLLVTAFLVIGLGKAAGVQTAFNADTMYLLTVDPIRDGYSAEKAQALFEKLPERLRQVGAVQYVALAEQPPFSIVGGTASLTTEIKTGKTAQVLKAVAKDRIGAGYFAALSEKVLDGREFEERDERADFSAPDQKARDQKGVAIPIILNETASLGLFGSGSTVGRRTTEDGQTYEVIGVVHDLKSGFVTGQPPAVVYLPLTRYDFAHPRSGGMTIMVRSEAGVDALNGIRREIAQIDPDLAIFNVRTLGEYLNMSKTYIRLALNMYGGIGVFGLALSAIGLAGVTAYAVARRRKEIGIRIALGARKSQVLGLVMREGTAMVAAGTALGILGAFAISRILSALTDMFVESFHMGTNDPRIVVGAPLLLAALAILACYIPARQSTRIDPLKALREE